MAFIIRLLCVLFVIFAVTNYITFGWRVANIDSTPTTFNNNCFVPAWNKLNTESTSEHFWNEVSKWLWIKLNLSSQNLHNNTENSIFAAYAYHDRIAVTITSQHLSRQEITCRYYDCERKEIPGSSWLGKVFPESVVECPRRYGAEYVSVSKNLNEPVPEPVKLIYRIHEEPVHELAVCVAPMYGHQPSWLPIVDFVEHNKLEGATHFYFYIGEISEYDNRMLNDYVRTGEVEVIRMQDKYQRIFLAWQFLQIQDCHLRSKYHSKWTAFIDLDERLSTNGQRMIDLLRSIQDPAIGEVRMQILSIVKDQDYPAKFASLEKMKSELIFSKYNKTLAPSWQGQKAIIKPNKVGIMSVHAAVAKFPGVKTLLLNSTYAVVRHLRSTKYRIYGSSWHLTPYENGTLPVFYETPLPKKFADTLKEAVIKRVLSVYEKIPVNCSTIPVELSESIRHPDPCVKSWPEFKRK